MRQVEEGGLGMLELIIVLVIWAACVWSEANDKRTGRYPRDWR